jgi:hypothetical protein
MLKALRDGDAQARYAQFSPELQRMTSPWLVEMNMRRQPKIRSSEITAVISGAAPRDNNVLRHAPHTAASLLADSWDLPYSRTAAAYPDAHSRHHKYWPPVGRVDNVHGDKHLVCTCDSVDSYAH